MLDKISRFAVVCAVLAAFPGPLVAQGVDLGLKGGLSIGNISSDDPELADTSTRTGFTGGAFVTLRLTDLVAIQAEGLFAQRGFSLSEAGSELSANLNGVTVPLLLKVGLPVDGSIRPGLYVGGSASFESSCTISGDIDGASVDEDCDSEQFDLERETTDFGVVLGGEVQIDLGGAFVLLDGRYDLGVRNLEVDTSTSTKSRTWSFMAGMGFHVN